MTLLSAWFYALLSLASVSALQNANHVFNSIHSSMRQWGSSLNHNGMSFYLASVPAGTQLYHGRYDPDPVKGVEWLAFEPEHAVMFARPMLRQRPPPPEKSPMYLQSNLAAMNDQNGLADQSQILLSQSRLRLLDDDHRPPPDFSRGWLHTYATKQDLQFLYVDGMSAAKSGKGTLESQDYLLLNESNDGRGGLWGDYERAFRLCRMSELEWQSRIAGFIRMEAGFEIIMCSFEDSLNQIRVTDIHPVVGANLMQETGLMLMTYLRNVAARYHGIGGGRVDIDYDSLVTAYEYTADTLEANSQHRLRDWPAETLGQVRNKVLDTIRSFLDKTTGPSINWQAVADMVVLRYTSWLPSLLTQEIGGNATNLLAELELILQPFTERDVRNASLEAHRCAEQFLPKQAVEAARQPVAAQAVVYIAHRVCETIAFAASDLDKVIQAPTAEGQDQTRLSEGVRRDVLARVERLVEYLQWTTWKECSGCGYNELCMLAIWPWGTMQDHEQPSCVNASQLPNRYGYWIESQPSRV